MTHIKLISIEKYEDVKRVGVLMGYDFPDDEQLAVYRNTAGAIVKMTLAEEMRKNQLAGLKKFQEKLKSRHN